MRNILTMLLVAAMVAVLGGCNTVNRITKPGEKPGDPPRVETTAQKLSTQAYKAEVAGVTCGGAALLERAKNGPTNAVPIERVETEKGGVKTVTTRYIPMDSAAIGREREAVTACVREVMDSGFRVAVREIGSLGRAVAQGNFPIIACAAFGWCGGRGGITVDADNGSSVTVRQGSDDADRSQVTKQSDGGTSGQEADQSDRPVTGPTGEGPVNTGTQ